MLVIFASYNYYCKTKNPHTIDKVITWKISKTLQTYTKPKKLLSGQRLRAIVLRSWSISLWCTWSSARINTNNNNSIRIRGKRSISSRSNKRYVRVPTSDYVMTNAPGVRYVAILDSLIQLIVFAKDSLQTDTTSVYTWAMLQISRINRLI